VRAIILAAGEGRRLRPLTQDRPKCLVPYQGRPLIDYQLAAMRACGLEDIVIVTGYQAEQVAIEGVQTVPNPRFATTNMVYSLFCAEAFFDDDVLVSYGDIVYGAGLLERVLSTEGELVVAVSMGWRQLWERRMADPLADAETLKMDSGDTITEIGRRASSYDAIDGQYMGLVRIRRQLLQPIRELYRSLDRQRLYDGRGVDDMHMTTLLQILIERGFAVRAAKVWEEWLEVDRPEDLEVVVEL
jgi:choline kinase